MDRNTSLLPVKNMPVQNWVVIENAGLSNEKVVREFSSMASAFAYQKDHVNRDLDVVKRDASGWITTEF